MADGGKRRSARLMELEEQKQETPTNGVVPTNHQQGAGNEQSVGRKRGRKNKGKEVYQEDNTSQVQVGPITDGNSSVDPSILENQTDRFIVFILDKLDITDKFGLFSMPDNIEEFDCNASLSSPGDIATLRQKYKDGLYTTLEQFENDVHIVFGKAVDSNSPDSIAYKEAKNVLDVAKKEFQFVRDDPEKAEEKLSKWHQETFSYMKSVINDQNAGTSSCTAQPEYDVVPSAKARGRPRAANSRPHGRKESEYPESSKEQWRHTYKPVSASDKSPEMVCDKQEQLVYNKNAMESFGSCSGLNNPGAESTTMAAKTALGLAPAHLEDAQLTAPNANVANPASSTIMDPSPTSKADDAVLGGPGCELETDKEFTVFSLMGTKVVVARSKSMASSSNQANKGDK